MSTDTAYQAIAILLAVPATLTVIIRVGIAANQGRQADRGGRVLATDAESLARLDAKVAWLNARD